MRKKSPSATRIFYSEKGMDAIQEYNKILLEVILQNIKNTFSTNPHFQIGPIKCLMLKLVISIEWRELAS